MAVMTKNYLSRSEVASRLEIKPSTLDNYVADGRFPKADATIGHVKGWTNATVQKELDRRAQSAAVRAQRLRTGGADD